MTEGGESPEGQAQGSCRVSAAPGPGPQHPPGSREVIHRGALFHLQPEIGGDGEKVWSQRTERPREKLRGGFSEEGDSGWWGYAVGGARGWREGDSPAMDSPLGHSLPVSPGCWGERWARRAEGAGRNAQARRPR